jgi:predicted Zn-dependent peptidase
MKRCLLIAVLPLLALSSAAGAEVKHPRLLKFPELEFQLPKTERVELRNGMVLHILENHELPVVSISAMVRIGSASEPEEMAGLGGLTGSVWRSGGTTALSPDELDERLEFIAASIETGIERRSGSISMSILKKDLDEGLELFADLIKNPAFDEKRFEVAKKRMLEGIKRENDSPSEIARREFTRLLLPNHPFGHIPTAETVSRIERSDCENFYKDHVGPENFIIGISGDFDSKIIMARFAELFEDFKPAKKKLPEVPPVPDEIKPGVYLVDKELQQTVFRSGHLGISRKNPDYYSARVMNFILGGGGFTSRLMQEIRSTRGLAYSVWSYLFGGDSDRGVFLTGGETKAASSYEFISATRDIIRRMIEKGVTDKELTLAKESIVNRFIFGFDRDSKIVSKYLWIEYNDLPRDYLDNFRDNIRKVTRSDAKKAARKYLHPDEMIILAVGDKSAIGEDLAKVGPVTTITLKQ